MQPIRQPLSPLGTLSPLSALSPLSKDLTGQAGEALASRYLNDLGWQILDRNWRCRDGELDLVARDGSVLVFCEVKTRSSVSFGDPAAAITAAKAGRIRRLAVRWLVAHPSSTAPELRFDVISILRPSGTRAQVRHVREAF